LEFLWACLNTPRDADFAEFLFQARRFYAGIPGCTSRKSNAGWGKKAVKGALEWVFRHALGVSREITSFPQAYNHMRAE